MLAFSKDHAVDLDWNQFKSTLQELYLGENLSLGNVRERMKAHQFYATNAQYELQFKKWNFRKYRTAEEWGIITQKLVKRKADNKESEVILDGKVLNPKKLRKQIQRYGRSSDKQYISLSIPCTPEGFIIRTPSPEICKRIPAQYTIMPSINLIPNRIDQLPFCRFNIAMSQLDNGFSGIQESRDSASTALTNDVQNSVVNEIKGLSNERAPRSFNQMIEALVPDYILKHHIVAEERSLSHHKESPALDFMKLTIYLISNNFFQATSAVSKKVYKWIKRRSNSGLMEYLLSVGGPTVEALTENLFQLA